MHSRPAEAALTAPHSGAGAALDAVQRVRLYNAFFKSIEYFALAYRVAAADYIAVAFDLDRKKLKRTLMYPEYKGTRKPMPDTITRITVFFRFFLAL